jgi:cell division protein ZapA (FtsZ GTPase activity inhibitor)
MSKLSLKITLAGRTYPLTVNEGEDEKILKAADDINRAIKLLQENYAVKDMQDLLAMTALQLATKSVAPSVQTNQQDQLEDVELSLEMLLEDLNKL